MISIVLYMYNASSYYCSLLLRLAILDAHILLGSLTLSHGGKFMEK